MKTSTNVIKKLARLEVLDVEQPVKYKNENDIIIKDEYGQEQKVLIDGITDEELPLLIAAEQLKILKSIKFFIKTSFILSLIGAGLYLLVYLIGLGSL